MSRLNIIDSHLALTILRNCFSLPKFLYIPRTSPTFKSTDSLREIDDIIFKGLSSVTNVSFEGPAGTQASLPVSRGGLGIRRACDIAIPAFLSSSYATATLVGEILNKPYQMPSSGVAEALTIWKAGVFGANEPLEPLKAMQKSWDQPMMEKIYDGLLQEADQVARARLLASAQKGSGACLHALPSAPLGTLLDDQTMRISVALRVGAPICEPHPCRCGSTIDSLGHHPLSCQYSAGRFPRHAALNDVIKRALSSAGVPSILEPVGLDRGDGKRPDGMTVYPFRHGQNLLWDATCIDTFAQSNVTICAATVGLAAENAETRKKRKYGALMDRYLFEPVAVETSGVCGPSTLRFLNELGRRIFRETGEPRETSWLMQRISIATVRGNAVSILACSRE